MDLAMIGLGRMGAGMAQRLIRAGHKVVGHDPDGLAVTRFMEKGGAGTASLEEAVRKLSRPRVLWMMVPAGAPVDETIRRLCALAEGGDILVDGGNSFYKDTVRRAAEVRGQGLHYVDCGTSGGVWGLQEGFSLMVGGEAEVVEELRPILESLAPAADRGWGRVGPSGAGHFVKMVHNGIEYGLMQAYAEGFSILERKEDFSLDLGQVAEIWRSGSVVRSWLLDLMADALRQNPKMEGVAPFVEDSGEGRWTLLEAIGSGVPTPVIALSLFERFRSREMDSFSDKLLAVTRNQFGGHLVKRES